MSSGPGSGTLSSTAEPRAAGDAQHRPHLFLVLDAHRPLAPPLRVALADLDEVVIGRGDAAPEEVTERGVRRLVLRTDDPRMSSTHARLARVLKRWVIDDAGSKNGTLVNGAAQARAALADGDVIELGHTFFVFRAALACDPEAPPLAAATALRPPAPGLVTMLPALGEAFARLAPIARSTVSVLLEGETGTGKEVVARALHALSGRTGAFVAVNCGALPRELVEAELFGHRKGAFSGAGEERPGLVRSADGGTLFLDEIGDLPLPSQAAFLRVLQEREVRPVGGTRPAAVDLRVVAATHRPLRRMVEAGAFRADLLARVEGHALALPPLRERREDLGLLVGALLARLAPGRAPSLHRRAARALLRHAWPANVRELEKCLETAVVLAREGGQIEAEHLSEAVQRALAEPSAQSAARDAALRDELLAQLRRHEGNLAAVARAMGKARMQVQRWMKRFELDPASFRR